MNQARLIHRLAAALEGLLVSYAYPKDPALFRATELAAKRGKRALAAYYRGAALRGRRQSPRASAVGSGSGRIMNQCLPEI
jgi:hypothetical protein